MANWLGRLLVVAGLLALMAATAATRQLAPGYVDPRPVLQAAARTLGNDNLNCVAISGSGYAGAVGQQREAGKNVDWPHIDALTNYTRTMN